jgi:hypothetical protein
LPAGLFFGRSAEAGSEFAEPMLEAVMDNSLREKGRSIDPVEPIDLSPIALSPRDMN